jgi:hypothetical protein
MTADDWLLSANPGGRSVSEDIDIVQELLDSEPAVQALGFPVRAKAAAEVIRTLRKLAPGNDVDGICKAWNSLSGALGPRLTAALLSGPDWQSFCPISRPLDDYDSTDHTQVVWIGSAHRVVGNAVFDGKTFLGLQFTAEPR